MTYIVSIDFDSSIKFFEITRDKVKKCLYVASNVIINSDNFFLEGYTLKLKMT